jgi:hypothetical protein
MTLWFKLAFPWRDQMQRIHIKKMFASCNPPFVLSGIPLSGQPGIIQECSTLFVLAPLRSAVSFQY